MDILSASHKFPAGIYIFMQASIRNQPKSAVTFAYTLVKNCTSPPEFPNTDKEVYGVSIGSTVRFVFNTN